MRASKRKWLRRAGGNPVLAAKLYGIVKLRRRARRAELWPFTESMKAWRADPWWIGYEERAAECAEFDNTSYPTPEQIRRWSGGTVTGSM